MSETPPTTPAERKKRYRERLRGGVICLGHLRGNRLWLAEMLYLGGFLTNPDVDDRAVLAAATQELLDALIVLAREEGRVPQRSSAMRYRAGGKDEST